MKRLSLTNMIAIVLMMAGIVLLSVTGVLAQEFTVNSDPDELTLSAGDPEATSTITIEGLDEGSASLDVESEPSGFNFSFSPTAIAEGQESNFTVTLSGASPGTYQVTVIAVAPGGEFVATTPVRLIVLEEPEGTFDLSARPSTRTVAPGESDSYTVTGEFDDNYSGRVSLSVSGLPSGATSNFDPDTLSPSANGSSQLEIVTDDSVSPGSYTLTITGDDGKDRQTVEVTLIVEGDEPPEEGAWELFIDPEEKEIEPGNDVKARLFANFSGGCTGPIAIDIDGTTSEYIKDVTSMDDGDFDDLEDPDYIYARLRQSELNTEGENDHDSFLDIKAGGNVPAGIYAIKVDGSTSGAACGDDEQSVVLELIIGEVNVTLEKSQSKSSLTPGMTQVYTISVFNENSPELTNLVITDTLDSRLTYGSDNSGKTPVVENGAHVWEFKDLGKGEKIEFQVTTTVDDLIRQGASVSNRFTVTADQLIEPLVSNTVTATMGVVTVDPDDLKVTKRKIGGRPSIGGILTYRIEVENVGGGALFGVNLIDDSPRAFQIPTGKTVRDGKAFADPVYRGGKYTWNLGNLAAGERTIITYQMVIGTNADSGENKNCAEAEGQDGGGNRVSGSDCAIVNLDDGDVEWLGQITAKAYLDVDGNGIKSAADEPLEGIEFILVGGDHTGTKQPTDEEGETEYLDLESGQYVLALNTRVLDPQYQFIGEDARLVRLLEGEKAEEIFLLSPGVTVTVDVSGPLCEGKWVTLTADANGCTIAGVEWYRVRPEGLQRVDGSRFYHKLQGNDLLTKNNGEYLVKVACDQGIVVEERSMVVLAADSSECN